MTVFKEYSKYGKLYMNIIRYTIQLESSVGENI